MRSLTELLDRQEPALPLLRSWIDDPGGNGGTLLPPVDEVRTVTLLRLQVTTRSLLGTLAYETGGVSVADGLVRLLGSGARRSLIESAEAAGCPLDGRYPDVVVVGDDVLGGLFALNGGRFGANGRGQVFHLAADNTVWVPLGVGYTDFVAWCLTGDLDRLYEPFADLDAYVARPRPAFDATYSFYPFLWTREATEGRPDVRVLGANECLRLRLELFGFAVG
jgi:hypothetical protein